MPVALEPLFRLGWSLRRIQRVMVAGYEAMHTIRKGQIRCFPRHVVGQVQFIQRILGMAA
jgi:hypothetical protein